MGNKRNLKRTINYICGDLFTEVIAASLYGDNVNKENIEALLTSIVLLRNNYVGRISHIEPGMKAKDYFKDLFETVGAEEVAEVEPTEETVEPTEEKPKAKAKGKKAEETAE